MVCLWTTPFQKKFQNFFKYFLKILSWKNCQIKLLECFLGKIKKSNFMVFGKFQMQKTTKSVGKTWNFFQIRYQRKNFTWDVFSKILASWHFARRFNASKVQNLKYSIFEHQNNIFPIAFFRFFFVYWLLFSLLKTPPKICCGKLVELIFILINVFSTFKAQKNMFPQKNFKFNIMNLDWKFDQLSDSIVKTA
jgi:hypothetical protein